MTTASVSTDSTAQGAAARATVDVFGVRWPRYKVEAVLAAALVFVAMSLVTATFAAPSPAPAVLAATAAGTVVWWLGRAARRH